MSCWWGNFLEMSSWQLLNEMGKWEGKYHRGCRAHVQSLTLTPLKHFGPLKGGWVGGWVGLQPKNTQFFEPPWCQGNIPTHAPCAATSRSTNAKSNLADHLIMISTCVISHKPSGSGDSGRGRPGLTGAHPGATAACLGATAACPGLTRARPGVTRACARVTGARAELTG